MEVRLWGMVREGVWEAEKTSVRRCLGQLAEGGREAGGTRTLGELKAGEVRGNRELRGGSGEKRMQARAGREGGQGQREEWARAGW